MTCSRKGCNSIHSTCRPNNFFTSLQRCSGQCRCDAACLDFGDCCYDYWHFCLGSHHYNINRELPALSEWSEESLDSLSYVNNSVTSLLKYQIYSSLQVKKPVRQYARCKSLSTRYFYFNFQVVDNCPSTLMNLSLKEMCEGPDWLTLAPVYNLDIAVFKNQYCVLCHGLSISKFKPIAVSFHCRKNFVRSKKVDDQMKLGNITAVRRYLFGWCEYSVEVMKNKQHHGTAGLKYEWMMRQSCIKRSRTCYGCEPLCTSFIMHTGRFTPNPFDDGCDLEVLKRRCKLVGVRRFKPKLPSYSLLFSINKNAGLKMRKFSNYSKYSYETYCEGREKLDFFNDTCTLIDLNMIANYRHLFMLNTSKISEKYAILYIIPKLSEKHLQNSEFEPLEFKNESLCYKFIKNNILFTELRKDTSQLHGKFCLIEPEMFEEFTEAYENVKNLLPFGKAVTEVLIFNTFLQNSTENCNSGDVFSTKAYIFNSSGDFMLVTNIGNQQYMARLNESTIVVRLKPDGESLRLKGSVMAFYCRKKKIAGADYLGIVTVVCNSISLAFLFATISLYVMVKPLCLKVACAFPHLALSLFLAQILFQVSQFLHKVQAYLVSKRPRRFFHDDYSDYKNTNLIFNTGKYRFQNA